MMRLLVTFLISLCGFVFGAKTAERPNIVLIYADDLGWGDLSCYGNGKYKTPHIDQMAAEGARLESFYVATPSCAPSRVALLTGRFPYRTGVPSNPTPDAGRDHGIHQNETTLAELLKPQGYTSTIIGKWHLGHLEDYYPTRHGFDSYFGILYSNDMRPVMLCRDEQAVEYPVVQGYLTRRYTDRALAFLEENRDKPFFLYLPHAMPHKPLAASDTFYTPETRDDLYADVVRELDASVGEVLARLKELDLDKKTLVIFSSDNGPWYGGSTGGLSGMKGSGWEGGVRVPAIFRWPGRIPEGREIKSPAATVDILPTVAGLLDIDVDNLDVDGQDIWPLLSGQVDSDNERIIYTWNGVQLLAVRQGKWKLHATRPRSRPRGKRGDEWIDPRGPDGATIIAPFEQAQPWQYPSPADREDTAAPKPWLLFDLENDPGEQVDVAAENPEIVKRLRVVAESALKEASTVPQKKMERATTKYYKAPRRITPDTPISIGEMLRQSRGE
ncbi:MAG: sulfatase [Verrucomicrobiales bacterium]|nr:sulfatase [Verrucomicrobiales bacterium]